MKFRRGRRLRRRKPYKSILKLNQAFELLEPRMLLSTSHGNGSETIAQAGGKEVTQFGRPDWALSVMTSPSADDSVSHFTAMAVQDPLRSLARSTSPREIVFVDGGIDDYHPCWPQSAWTAIRRVSQT